MPTLDSGEPILSIDWRTVIAGPEWAARMVAADRLCDTRVEVINSSGVRLQDITPDAAAVSFDAASTARFRGDLEMVDEYPVDSTDLLHPLSGNQVRIWWQEWVPTLGGWVEVPMMTGRPEDPSLEKSPALTWTLTLFDTITEVLRGGYGGQSIDVSGMTTGDALSALVGLIAPGAEVDIPSGGATLPANYMLGSNKPSDDQAAIGKPAGWAMCSDRLGVVTVDQGDLPTVAVADWAEGDGCRVTKLSRDVKTSEIVNAVRVTTSSTEIAPPLVAIVQDDDPGSPTFVGVYGPYWFEDTTDAATDQAGVEAVAQSLYSAKRFPIDSVKVDCPARPDMFARSLVTLGSPDAGVAGGYRVQAWRIQCPKSGEAPQQMSVTMADKQVI